VVFLQGPSSPFFAHAAKKFLKAGAETLKISFCPGDDLYWCRNAGRRVAYRGRPQDFPIFLRRFLAKEQPSDIVMLGDGRPYHRMTIELLAEMAIERDGQEPGQSPSVTARPPGKETAIPTPWIVEHGYLRPDLILLETWGMGARSSIPRAFLQRDLTQPPAGPATVERFPASFLRYGLLDFGYHLSNLGLGPVLYPHYRPYAIDGPVREYAGWIGKALCLPRRRRAARLAAAGIEAHRGPIYLFPLQLAGDFQIRYSGTGETLAEILDRVIASFARHAPADALLVIRQHPLDNGLARWGRRCQNAAIREGIAAKVIFQDGGSGADVLARARAVVTVNSTMGLEALRLGLPCHLLGRAIYSLPGLANQGSLEAFWQNPVAPDPGKVSAFTAFLLQNYHFPGSFDGPGALVGAENLVRRLREPPPPIKKSDIAALCTALPSNGSLI
jgi:capsular polysaccharide export protein